MTAGAVAGSSASEPDARGTYRERAERFERRAAELGARSRRVSNFRGLAFGVAVVAALAALISGTVGAAPIAVAAGVVFVALVGIHARVIRDEDDALRLTRVNLDALARVEGRSDTLPDDGARFVSDAHPYASDLDVFGSGSLYQRINVGHTRFGQQALASFLTTPAETGTIRRRQEAARAFSPKIEERQRLEALALSVVEPPPGLAEPGRKKTKPQDPPDPEPLLGWAEGAPRLSGQVALRAAAYVLPPLTLATLAAVRWLHLPPACSLVPIVLSILAVLLSNGEAERVFSAVSSTRGAFLRYGPMFELVERLDVSSVLLRDLRAGLVSSDVRPSDAMKRFERIVGWFDLRHNGLIHPFANVFLLWDLNCVLRLEAWQKDAGRRARSWFSALGEIEAISAFAGLAFDEPGFVWPEVSDGPAHFEAEGLVHPLLPSDKRVPNDVAILAPGQALLITGSNMSGKSTLLRAMGANVVLALAGAPVSARRLALSRLAVWTSMKIGDSLHRGVSHFYAEVQRLRGVLDATSGTLPVFFLLDEILHGTNSEERQIGARWLLGELLRRNAIGAVSTHDVELCRLPDSLMDRVHSFHFRESIDHGVMSFDYLLRPGPVSRGNALHVMRLAGLPVPVDSESRSG